MNPYALAAILALALSLPMTAAAVSAPGARLPNLAVATPDLTLRAYAEPNRLLVHVTRGDSDQPVRGAQVEMKSGNVNLVARPAGDGDYAIPGEWGAQTGQYEVTFKVAGDGLETAAKGILRVPAAPPPPAEDGGLPLPWLIGIGALALFLSPLLAVLRGARRDSRTG